MPGRRPYRVRFDEAGPDGLLRTSVLLRYAQDVAWHHSTRSVDMTGPGTPNAALAWLVPHRGSHRGDGHTGRRGACRHHARGWLASRLGPSSHNHSTTQAARPWPPCPQIDWVLPDGRGAPTRIPAEFEPVFGAADCYGRDSRAWPSATRPRRRRQSAITVRPPTHELDPMAHVNNAVYADWLEEAVIAGGGADARSGRLPRLVRLEYARAAEAGASVDAATWRDEDRGWSCRITDTAGADLLRARLERIAPRDDEGRSST